MQLALVGIAVGLAAAVVLTRLMTSLLYDLTPTDFRRCRRVARHFSPHRLLPACTPGLLHRSEHRAAIRLSQTSFSMLSICLVALSATVAITQHAPDFAKRLSATELQARMKASHGSGTGHRGRSVGARRTGPPEGDTDVARD